VSSKATMVSQKRMQLKFTNCKLVPKAPFLPTISLPFIPFDLPANWNGGNIVDILYLDDELQITKNHMGTLFIASRLYECWQPLKKSGWGYVSMV